MNLQVEKDILKLIDDEVEESLHLDYKSADSLQKTDGKKNEISKDVSAFANSDGGTIIYGIKEFDSAGQRHLPELIDPVDRNEISKEWLEHVINSKISPRLQSIEITPINIDSSTDKVVYVVNIPKSNTAHQASNLRYYQRYNFESIAMYDYEIRDVLNRSSFPKIEIYFKIESYKKETNSSPFNISNLGTDKVGEIINTLKVFARNSGEVYANYVNAFLEIPQGILSPDEYDYIESYEKDGMDYKTILCDNTIREVSEFNMGYPKYWPSRYDPILPGTKMRLDNIRMKSNSYHGGLIYWRVNADNAPVIHGSFDINKIPVKNILKS